MPVTAKLSRRFYDQFGDEITNELVDWMNSVDATYQSTLRELNEINFARFDAKLEQRVAAIENRIDRLETTLHARLGALENRLAALENRLEALESRLTATAGDLRGLEQRMDAGFARLHQEFADRLAASESRMLRWMIGLWTSSSLATVGLLFAILRTR